MDLPPIKSVRSLANLTQPEISCPESQDFLSTLPTEMFRAILELLQILEMIPLRLVSNRWNVVIESICSDKKYLVIMHQPNKYYLSELMKQFNLNELSKNTVVLKMKYTISNQRREIHLSSQLCTLLAKLFPRIEQFYILDYSTYSSTEFRSMLRQWSPNLTLLCVCLYHSEDVNHLCTQINQLTNLRQLNLVSPSVSVNQLAPTLSRLEHLSSLGFESIDKIAPYLGASFASLGCIYRRVTLKELTNWHQLNARSVSNLLRFGFYTDDPEIVPFICKHFSSLQMLRLTISGNLQLTTGIIVQHLTSLTHLTDFQINNLTIDSSSLDGTNLKPLLNIRILTLADLSINDVEHLFDLDLPENAFRLCRFLSAIFPNVERLIIETLIYYPQFGHLLTSHVDQFFANLRSHNFNLNPN